MRILAACVFAMLFASPLVARGEQLQTEAITLVDTVRGRDVAVQLYHPATHHRCVALRSCPVAFLSPGYGVPHTSYSFLVGVLAEHGYLSVAVQHDLPTDPPLSGKGDLVAVRTPAWRRGAANLRFVKGELARTHPQYEWSALALIGHSNGGDISAYLLAASPDFAQQLVTLDHRRVQLPRNPSLQVLSIRGSDFEADPGVLPPESEPEPHGACIVEIPGSRHNDMHDGGPPELKVQIGSVLRRFLAGRGCGV